jgi:hypothetical protein
MDDEADAGIRDTHGRDGVVAGRAERSHGPRHPGGRVTMVCLRKQEMELRGVLGKRPIARARLCIQARSGAKAGRNTSAGGNILAASRIRKPSISSRTHRGTVVGGVGSFATHCAKRCSAGEHSIGAPVKGAQTSVKIKDSHIISTVEPLIWRSNRPLGEVLRLVGFLFSAESTR